MIVCVPVTADGQVDPRWGRAERLALATVNGETIEQWREIDVHWATLHDAAGEGQHHARVVRFLQENGVQAVVADHMGPPMERMLSKMGITVRLGARGPARAAVCEGRMAPASGSQRPSSVPRAGRIIRRMDLETDLDPVCGMTVIVSDALEHELAIEYEGREYVFCAPGCKAAFVRDSARYGAVGRSAR